MILKGDFNTSDQCSSGLSRTVRLYLIKMLNIQIIWYHIESLWIIRICLERHSNTSLNKQHNHVYK